MIGSNTGGPRHPVWVHNLRSTPAVTITVGRDTIPVVAREIVEPKRRAEIVDAFITAHRAYTSYELPDPCADLSYPYRPSYLAARPDNSPKTHLPTSAALGPIWRTAQAGDAYSAADR